MPNPPQERTEQDRLVSAINAARELVEPADGALDEDTYDEKSAAQFDAPDDAEWSVRAGTVRQIHAAFKAVYKIFAAFASSPQGTVRDPGAGLPDDVAPLVNEAEDALESARAYLGQGDHDAISCVISLAGRLAKLLVEADAVIAAPDAPTLERWLDNPKHQQWAREAVERHAAREPKT